jgi:DNA-directed RNA polymerase specialized sigma24 family protein
MTRLASFEGRSSFRTWLYRVVFNHLNMKRGREEEKSISFSVYGDALDNTPDLDLPESEGYVP